MALKPSPEELARALDDAGGLRLIRAGYSGYRNQAVLTFDWQGQQLQFLAAVIEVLEGEIPANAHARRTDLRNSGVMSHILQKKKHWTEYELRLEGLPLYLSDDWLIAQHHRVQSAPELRRTGTATWIEKRYGYSNQAISRRLIALGIETRPRNTDQQREMVRELLRQGQFSYTAIAKQAGVSKATVTRLARTLDTALKTIGNDD